MLDLFVSLCERWMHSKSEASLHPPGLCEEVVCTALQPHGAVLSTEVHSEDAFLMAWWAVRSEQSRHLHLTSLSVRAAEKVGSVDGIAGRSYCSGFPRK